MPKSDSNKSIRIGTRATKLAIRQAEILSQEIINKKIAKIDNIEIIPIKSSGDYVSASIGPYDGKLLFTKEIDQALIDKRIDIAAHSVKDLESNLAAELELHGVLEREDPRDALITVDKFDNIDDLPRNCLIGSASPRREAIIRSIREDVRVIEYRGNFETRIKKLLGKEVDATFLAMAGIKRLNYKGCYILPIETREFLPAAGQGAIGLIIRKDDMRAREIVTKLNHQQSYDCIQVERKVMEKFGGSCFQPLAIHAYYLKNDEITIDAVIYSKSGSKNLHLSGNGTSLTIFDIAGDIGQRLLNYYNEHLLNDIN